LPVSGFIDGKSDAKITKKLEYATPKKPLPSDFAYSETVFANSESHQMEKTISDGLRGYLAVLRIHVETV
jgi:hypothetical protein